MTIVKRVSLDVFYTRFLVTRLYVPFRFPPGLIFGFRDNLPLAHAFVEIERVALTSRPDSSTFAAVPPKNGFQRRFVGSDDGVRECSLSFASVRSIVFLPNKRRRDDDFQDPVPKPILKPGPRKIRKSEFQFVVDVSPNLRLLRQNLRL